MKTGVTLLFFLTLCPAVWAGSVCDYYKTNNKTLYKSMCSNGGGGSRPSGAQSTIGDSLTLNAGNLPTAPTSYGMEGLYSFIKKDVPTNHTSFGLVKGFKRRGAGVFAGDGNTFYSNDLLRREYSTPELENFEPFETPKGKHINFNVGFANTVLESSNGVQLKLGLSLRYNKGPDSWGGGPSLMFETPWTLLGTGVTQIKIASNLPTVNFISSVAGLRIYFVELEYNRLDSQDIFDLGPVHIGTASLKVNKFIVTAAVRRSNFRNFGEIQQKHFSLQYLISSSFSMSYLDNYIPGCRTLGLQLYL